MANGRHVVSCIRQQLHEPAGDNCKAVPAAHSRRDSAARALLTLQPGSAARQQVPNWFSNTGAGLPTKGATT